MKSKEKKSDTSLRDVRREITRKDECYPDQALTVYWLLDSFSFHNNFNLTVGSITNNHTNNEFTILISDK